MAERQMPRRALSQAVPHLTEQKISNVFAGRRKLSAEELDTIRRFFGYRLPEELDEKPQSVAVVAADAAGQSIAIIDAHTTDAPQTLVPVYDVAASAGYGALVEEETVVHSIAFPPEYLRQLTRTNPSNLAVISVKGESMEPTLLDNDIVLVDMSKRSLSYDGLFVLRFDEALHVKRVGRSPKRQHVTIISDNRELYPPMEANASDIEPVGKVLWYGRKV